MAKKNTKKKTTKKQKRGSLLSRIFTYIGALIVGIATLIGAILGGFLESTPDSDISAPPAGPSGSVQAISVQQGFGAQKGFWQIYFTAPTGSTDASTYVGGIDTPLIEAINNVQRTLDIAAFEWNNPAITQAVVAAKNRGVVVRMAVDDEHALEDEDSTISQITRARIPVVDDSRGGLMHNKFMIMDSTTVWTGSMNFTMNDTYRNNNNLLMLRARRAVEAYQAEFNEMFVNKQFGSSRSAVNSASFTQDGTSVQIYFSPEDDVIPKMLAEINRAQSRIRFMAFSFTRDDIGRALLSRSRAGVTVEGIFEVRGSRTQFSELPLLFCAGLDIREDGNPFTFHHKVFIIDDHTVLTGSFNISDNATSDNDENMLIINDPDLVAQYIAEYNRVKAQSAVPPRAQITCP